MKTIGRNWLFAFALTIPMIVFFILYFINHVSSLSPTGFIQYDNVSYIAYARQYTDHSWSQLFYNNPFNVPGGDPPIYFQPQTIFFAILLATGIPAGYILIPFTWICAMICFRLIIAIYDQLVPSPKYRSLTIWLFGWGGGLLALTGYLYQQISSDARADSIFYLDPAAGWWGLNFGRSLFFSCEAYYHALFLAVIYSVLKKKWAASIGFSFLLSISHPFTGIELLAIILVWCLTEKFYKRNPSIPNWFVLGQTVLLGFHLFYYLYFLNQYEEHASVSNQYALNWRLRYFTIIPAYCLVAILAGISFWSTRNDLARKLSNQSLFLSWFVVAFLLANHELFIKPMQPLHFTRGYIWTSLFILGIPGLNFLFDKVQAWRRKGLLLIFFCLLFFSDNYLWIAHQFQTKAFLPSTSYIDREQEQLLEAIEGASDHNTLLISRDELISYLSTIYSPATPWYSHPYTTAFALSKQQAIEKFYSDGSLDASWKSKKLLFIFRKNEEMEKKRSAAMTIPVSPIFDSKNYQLVMANHVNY